MLWKNLFENSTVNILKGIEAELNEFEDNNLIIKRTDINLKISYNGFNNKLKIVKNTQGNIFNLLVLNKNNCVFYSTSKNLKLNLESENLLKYLFNL